jgi:thiamine-phosphate pyrophosphorylase
MLLYYITDRRSCAVPLKQAILQAFDAGVDMVQIREKDLEAGELYSLAKAVSGRGRTLVNGRLDVALAAGAAGVHLPSSAPPASHFRRIAPRGFLIAVSCHSAAEVRAAYCDGADFAVFGPVFDTPSKRAYGDPQGLERLAEACAAAPIPVLALGGVTLANAEACLRQGAAGIAGISLFQGGSNVAEVVAALRSLGSAV